MRSILDLPDRHAAALVVSAAQATDEQLESLARAWANPPEVRVARRHALDLDMPRVLSLLAVIEAAEDALLYDDPDDRAEPPDDSVHKLWFNALRDAMCATVAAPYISEHDFEALATPWISVLGPVSAATCAFTEQPALEAMVGVVRRLAGRCHDEKADELYVRLLERDLEVDLGERYDAWAAADRAVQTMGRQRVVRLLAHHIERGLGSVCERCGAVPDDDVETTAPLLVGAVSALVVEDVVDAATVRTATSVLHDLIPHQRRA